MTGVVRRWRIPVVVVSAVVLALLIAPSTAGAQTRERRTDIRIVSDSEFDEAHGVRSGSGTPEDPYVISGWEVNSLYIKDTNASVVITDNRVNFTMTLDWIGRDVTVTGNDVNDLRVNQNVRRTGLPTSGVISDNRFSVVGQLRHWDGEFSRNVVGVPYVRSAVNDLQQEFTSRRAVNFDGFNGAHFTDNDIYGYVDVRIHGHHHSSGFGDDSHNHTGDHDGMDHSQRYHEVFFHHNRITVPPGDTYALQYVDNNHAGNDRTATSETNPDLNNPHVHYTRVHLTDNTLTGSGLLVNIFNADDSLHTATSTGLLAIERNTITLERSTYLGSGAREGITVQRAEDVDLRIEGNAITGPPDTLMQQQPLITVNASTGISLVDIDKGTVRVYDNHVADTLYGLRASQFPASTRWFVDGLHTDNVRTPIQRDSSVANDYEQRPAEDGEHHDDDGGGHQHG